MSPSESEPAPASDPSPVSEESPDDQSATSSEDTRPGVPVSRRVTLTGIAGLVGIGLLAEDATAKDDDEKVDEWNKNVDASGHRLLDLEALRMLANPTEITDFEGTNLSIDGTGVLNAVDTDTDTHASVSDDGSQVLADVEDINFASNLTVTDDGDGTVSVDASDGSPWEDADGDGLLEAPSVGGIDVQFVKTPGFGTTDFTALEGVVNDDRFVRIEPTATIPGDGKSSDEEPAANLVAGQQTNSAVTDIVGATIAGGGSDLFPNTVESDWGTIGGGKGNTVNNHATVAGGFSNRATSFSSTVSGGDRNRSEGNGAAVGGGNINNALGAHSTIPGGFLNNAGGESSFAAGRSANAQHDGAIVFGDSTGISPSSSGANQFVVQAGGGATLYSSSDLSTGVALPAGSGSWSSLSTRTAKMNIQSVDTKTVLDSVEQLDISTWEYESEEDATHMGPMAEDFHDAFELGDSDRRIATVDADGIALAAIQGLARRLDTHIDVLRSKNVELRAENGQLQARLNNVERRLAALETGS